MDVSLLDYRESPIQNATVTTNGSVAYTGYGAKEVTLIINVTGSVTGTSPTLTFTIQEVDPGDGATSVGTSKVGAAITSTGTQVLTLPLTVSSSLKVSWAVGGSSPSFGGVYATLVSKVAGSHAIYDNSGNGPVAVKSANTAAVASDAALVVAISPNSNTITSGALPDTTASGALGAANAVVQIALTGQRSVGMQLAAGTLVGTIVPETSKDGGTTWNPASFIDPTSKAISPSLIFTGGTNNATDKSFVTTGGCSHMRVRVSAYTSGSATASLRAVQLDPEPPMLGVTNNVYPRAKRLDRFGNTRVGFDNLLMADAIEGATLNSWLWSTSTSTMTITQGTGIITMNASSTLTSGTYAILTSKRQFQVMDHAPVRASFYVAPYWHTNTVIEFGFGAPTTTSALSTGAWFKVNGTGSVDCSFLGGGSGNTNVGAVTLTISPLQTYHFVVELEDFGARFIIDDGQGNNLLDINVNGFGAGGTSQTLQVSHIPIFARVYNSGLATTASQLYVSGISVLGMDLDTVKPWPFKMASTGRSPIISPTAFTQTPQLAAGAAPAAGTPSNTTSLYTTLGGEFICSASATSENLLSIFGFTIPSPYTFYLTGIFIPPCIVAGAATATTATVLEFSVIANCSSTNISTGGGFRFTIPGLFQVASGAAIGTVFNGQQCVWVPITPIACLPGTVLHIAYKVILGTATSSNQNRGSVYVDGYYE